MAAGLFGAAARPVTPGIHGSVIAFCHLQREKSRAAQNHLPFKMFTCAKFVSTPALVRAGSRSLYRPVSAAVLSRPEVKPEVSAAVLPQLPFTQVALRGFQTSAVSRDIDTAAKFIGAGAATVGVAGSGAGIGTRFTNEDHLAVHKHKHEMTLRFGPARNDSVIIADQTPTPTRFLKNCEEVGLFNELTSPFEHDFKKATEDDIKKLPLDLSPLATPVVRNKIEEHTPIESHRDSPLPHPESTTTDDKEVSLQPTSLPPSTIVRPASLQVPNVLLASNEAGVVIQQALPSPTSSSVITQVPSSSRPIVPVSGTFPVLLQLPNGQTMPVAIPATIASSSVHIPTAIPLVRPVTVVPSVPGIPGPSSPQPVQSEAKMKLKAALSQQLPQVTNGDAGDIQSSSASETPPPAPPPAEEPRPKSLQQPATSTTETPVSPAPPAQHTTSTGGRRRRTTSEDPDEKRRKFLERNRAAASRCRQKRKSEVTLLRSEVAQLKQLLLAHKDCPVTLLQKKSGYHRGGKITQATLQTGQAVPPFGIARGPSARGGDDPRGELDKEDSCGEMSVPSSPQNEAIQHSSISTSNGVSSSTAATAPLASGPALGPAADHSTEEEDDSHVGGASSSHTQSSGS
ncbi:cyclic AMP-dependent transcription factor ATF-2 [Labeo rohita]|uniref:Cyclic AMP-dependent transcription factor ATF-2 n=1 Tax=Labeo rohita TaxID=84645 RepID=A0A498LGT5_LABRO|nr:cyclic AMP-dependent transcription factor ATF-2 [Labeo rohita]